MLQFKIYINKITYLTSVHLIKVRGRGGQGFVKVFMSCMCELNGEVLVRWVQSGGMCYKTCHSTIISYRRTTHNHA